MITLSLCMIVRDEEETLAQCLDSVKDIADEIIVVDTGSVDRTKEIAGKFTKNLYDFEWIDDFSAARNFSFSKATQEYILWLDADDVLLEEDRNKLKYLKQQLDTSIDIVMLKYNLGTDDNGKSACTFYRERLLKRSRNYEWHDTVHEYINPIGKITVADIAVTHKKKKTITDRNLKILEKIIADGKELSHRNCFYFARELNVNGRHDEAKNYYEKFLSQEGGLTSNYMDVCIDLSKIYLKEGDKKSAIKTLIRYFEFGIPRAEICCELGSIYKESNDLERAICWYDLASRLNKPVNTLGSVMHDCYDYIPYAEMSACYFKLGLIQQAIQYNEKAGQYKPDSPLVINNRNYFETIIKNAKMIP